MNILITGANGQLGNELQRRVAALSPQQYLFTDVAELDITNIAAIRQVAMVHHIKVIVNCAAYTNVDKAEDDAEMADLLNNKAVENLATVAKEVGATLIHISTDYVFQGNKSAPCRETWKPHPISVYGRTKLAGEQAILRSGCNYIIIRTAWLYSEFGNNFVKTMLRLTTKEDHLKVIVDQVGTPTYAGDLAYFIHQIIDTGQLNKQGIYHYSNEGVCSWYDFAWTIATLSEHTTCHIVPCRSNEFPSKVKRPRFSVLDKAKVKKTFGVEVPYWQDSLAQCIELLKYRPRK